MIDIVKDLPFEECETCQLFEPSFQSNKMFADNECVINEIEVHCSSSPVCREIRRQLKLKEGKPYGADK